MGINNDQEVQMPAKMKKPAERRSVTLQVRVRPQEAKEIRRRSIGVGTSAWLYALIKDRLSKPGPGA